MTIRKILGESGPMSELCNGNSCPAAILGSDGNIYVQGYLLNAGVENQLKAPSGEGFVSIPLETAKKIAAQLCEL